MPDAETVAIILGSPVAILLIGGLIWYYIYSNKKKNGNKKPAPVATAPLNGYIAIKDDISEIKDRLGKIETKQDKLVDSLGNLETDSKVKDADHEARLKNLEVANG